MSRELQESSVSSRKPLGSLFLGVILFALLAVGCQNESPESNSTTKVDQQPAEGSQTPAELEALNAASRKMYAAARQREIAKIPAAILVSGDDLILRKNGKRTVSTVIPREYHTLKSIAHTTLALFAHLSSEPGKPLDDERMKRLKEYEALLTAAGPIMEKAGLDAPILTRQKRLLARALEFTSKVLQDGKVSADDLAKFCHSSRPDILANGAEAARAQLLATHKQVMEWKKDMTAEEWSTLTVIVSGAQTARVENAAVQYFARLFGESNGEGRRVVYAESLWDEEKAINLLGTLRLDGKLSTGVFGDPFRMYRDFLADGARTALDDIFAAP